VDSSGVTHGFIKDGPNFTTVDVPGTISTGPISINDEGDIVGTYYFDFTSSLPYAGQQGFILHAGTLYTFPVPGYGGITAINDLGVLSGTYIVDPAVENIWTGFVAVPKF
jgi:hypothetical protein